jgi:hypothetical protein
MLNQGTLRFRAVIEIGLLFVSPERRRRIGEAKRKEENIFISMLAQVSRPVLLSYFSHTIQESKNQRTRNLNEQVIDLRTNYTTFPGRFFVPQNDSSVHLSATHGPL